MNALVEPEVIRALYRASGAGVHGGPDRARPVLPAAGHPRRLRQHPRAARSSGRFLEHSRVYYFHADGDERVMLASADWMERNFFRRVEVCFSIEDEELKARLLADLDICLSDNSEAWELRPDGHYELLHPSGNEPGQAAQATLLRQLSENFTGAGAS